MPELNPNLNPGPAWMGWLCTYVNNSHPKYFFSPLLRLANSQINCGFKYLIDSLTVSIDSKVEISIFVIVSKLPLGLDIVFEKADWVNFPFLNSELILFVGAIVGVDEKVLSFTDPLPQKDKILPWVDFLDLH